MLAKIILNFRYYIFSCEFGGTPAFNLSHQPIWPQKALLVSLSPEQSHCHRPNLLSTCSIIWQKSSESRKKNSDFCLPKIEPSLTRIQFLEILLYIFHSSLIPLKYEFLVCLFIHNCYGRKMVYHNLLYPTGIDFGPFKIVIKSCAFLLNNSNGFPSHL